MSCETHWVHRLRSQTATFRGVISVMVQFFWRLAALLGCSRQFLLRGPISSVVTAWTGGKGYTMDVLISASKMGAVETRVQPQSLLFLCLPRL